MKVEFKKRNCEHDRFPDYILQEDKLRTNMEIAKKHNIKFYYQNKFNDNKVWEWDITKMVEENNCNLIDIREKGELDKMGRVENSNHIPRGMLEFWLDPNSAYFKDGKLDMNKEMVLFCAGGVRSALAVKALQNMGYEKVSHIELSLIHI